MSLLVNYPRFKAFDDEGRPLSGGKLYSYAVGSVSTPVSIYVDSNCSIPWTNPIILNEDGEVTAYSLTNVDLFLYTSDDVLVWGPVTWMAGGSGGNNIIPDVRAIYPQTYGAIGDGVADDTTAVQAAIDAANGTIPVYFSGTFKVILPLVLPDYTCLIGPGTIYTAAAAPGLRPGNYCSVRDLTLRGTFGNYPGAWAISGLYQNGDPGAVPDRSMDDADWTCTHLFASNIRIEDFWGGIQPGPYSIVQGCQITNCRNEGFLLLGNGCQVVDNSIDTVGSWGVDINASEAVVVGNRLRECGNYATLGSLDGGCVVINSYVLTGGINQVTITGNIMNNSDEQGIYILAQTNPISNLSAGGNTILNVCRRVTNNVGAITLETQTGGTFSNVSVCNNTINTAANPLNNIICTSGSTSNVFIKNNKGFNPVGALQYYFGGNPSVPGSTVEFQNPFGFDCAVYISGGSVTGIIVSNDGSQIWNTGITSGSVVLPAGAYIRLDYTVTPTWAWFGL